MGKTSAGSGRLGAAAAYLAGGGVYAIAREVFGLDFLASPFLYGLVLLVAGRFRPRLLAPAILLLIWGTAVLIDGKGPIPPGRTAPLFVGAFGLGAGMLLALWRWIDAREALESIAVVMITVGIWFYLVNDYPMLERTWLWTAYFALNALGLVLAEVWSRRRRQPARALSDRASAAGAPPGRSP